jgi:hypothetical protein
MRVAEQIRHWEHTVARELHELLLLLGAGEAPEGWPEPEMEDRADTAHEDEPSRRQPRH